MNTFAIGLYISIFLFFQIIFTLVVFFYLPKSYKLFILDFLSSWFEIKIYYKQKIYNRTIKQKQREPESLFHLYEVINRHQINLMHYKCMVKFANEELAMRNYYQPAITANMFSKDVVVCPSINNLSDIDKFKLNSLIQRVQSDIRKMILSNPHLLVKQKEDFHSPFQTENWSFDLFLPNESIGQNVELGMIR